MKDIGAMAVTAFVDRLALAAAATLPADVTAERTAGGLVLSGPRVALRRLTEPELQALAAIAARAR